MEHPQIDDLNEFSSFFALLIPIFALFIFLKFAFRFRLWQSYWSLVSIKHLMYLFTKIFPALLFH